MKTNLLCSRQMQMTILLPQENSDDKTSASQQVQMATLLSPSNEDDHTIVTSECSVLPPSPLGPGRCPYTQQPGLTH